MIQPEIRFTSLVALHTLLYVSMSICLLFLFEGGVCVCTNRKGTINLLAKLCQGSLILCCLDNKN